MSRILSVTKYPLNWYCTASERVKNGVLQIRINPYSNEKVEWKVDTWKNLFVITGRNKHVRISVTVKREDMAFVNQFSDLGTEIFVFSGENE